MVTIFKENAYFFLENNINHFKFINDTLQHSLEARFFSGFETKSWGLSLALNLWVINQIIHLLESCLHIQSKGEEKFIDILTRFNDLSKYKKGFT